MLEREKQGKDVPELLDRPPLSNRTQWIMDLFDKLGTERKLGFGFWGPIPYSVVRDEALRLELGDDGFHEMWELIHPLDDQWRAEMNKQPEPGASGGRLPNQDNGRSVRRGKRKQQGD